jgi:hypothetical protein
MPCKYRKISLFDDVVAQISSVGIAMPSAFAVY